MSEQTEVDWLGRWNLYSPDNEALYDYKNQKSFSYNQLWMSSLLVADFLKKSGIGPGDRVAVLSPNCIETIILFFALQRLGGILVPLNFRLSPPEIDYIVTNSDPKILFYDENLLKTVQQLSDDLVSKKQIIDLNQITQLADKTFDKNNSLVVSTLSQDFISKFEYPCMILYTSGTTGFPKGAVLTNKMLFWNAINTSLSLNITQEDVTINFAPLFHTGGWNVLLTPFLFRGARTILFEKFEATEVLKIAAKEKVTLLFGVPTMLAMMSDAEDFKSLDISSIRYMVVGGEPMPLNLIQKWNEKGVPVRQGFGLTEFGPNCFSLSEKDAEKKMGSIGRSNFYVKTKIINSNGIEVGPNEVGELLLSGPSCMQGYWNNPKATDETIIDGWLHTGDLVKKDEDNYFYVVGRKKEMFISGGENVYPVEVEKVLRSHPVVTEAAVVGVKDQKWGEVGHAFIVCKNIKSKEIKSPELASTDLNFTELNSSEFNETEFKEFCRQNLAGYKIPKYFTLLDELPKGDSGKINKKVLLTYDFKGA